MHSPLRFSWYFLALPLLASTNAVVGCGDGTDPPADANLEQFTLEVLEPPGDAIGLAFSESIELRVRYSGATGQALRARTVEFTILTSGGESVGGSALSATVAQTDNDGVASIELIAGAEGAGFRVAVTAPQAAQATFFVGVSDEGFTRLLVEPIHSGPRSALSFSAIQLRLFRPSELRCPDAVPDALPESLLPPRSLGVFGGIGEFVNVPSNAGYTVVAWATTDGSPTALSFGCVELSAPQVRNFDVSVSVVTTDRAIVMTAAAIIVSTFDLSPVVADGALAQTPWTALGCPLGPGQLLVDCIADALVDDGVLDCDFQGTGTIADKIRAERGIADGGGCRPGQASGADSVDKLMQDAIALGASFPTASDLATILTIRDSIAGQLLLRSELRVGPATSSHRLAEAEVGPSPGYVVDLVASSRPIIEHPQVATATTPVGSPSPLSIIESHGFTLDYGGIAGAGFEALALTPAALDGGTLGTDLAGSVSSGALSSCPAASEVLCAAIGEPNDCAETACTAATSHLDNRLQTWWQRLSNLGGIDFELEGVLPLRDADNDLVVDSVGRSSTGAVTGMWTATVHTTGSPVSDIEGTAATQ